MGKPFSPPYFAHRKLNIFSSQPEWFYLGTNKKHSRCESVTSLQDLKVIVSLLSNGRSLNCQYCSLAWSFSKHHSHITEGEIPMPNEIPRYLLISPTECVSKHGESSQVVLNANKPKFSFMLTDHCPWGNTKCIQTIKSELHWCLVDINWVQYHLETDCLLPPNLLGS